ncbi:MAG: hypothetical protein HC880_04250 [Bacteroidia bacterium]|nr:hypothetical protein [Bacteroidia bacterium]
MRKLNVKDFFDCEYRGKIVAKGKGEVDMYFVNGIRTDLSESQDMMKPSPQFYDKMKEMGFLPI